MNDSDIHDLATPFGLDALEPDDHDRFARHLPDCSACAATVAEVRRTLVDLAAETSRTPPPDLRTRVMSEIASTPQDRPIDLSQPEGAVIDLGERRRRRNRLLAAGAAVAAAVILVAGVASLLRPDAASDQVGDVLAAPDAVVTTLEGPGGTLRVTWSAELDEAAVVGSGLADPGPGQTYQLWFLLDDGVAPAGVFDPGGEGAVSTVLDVDDLDASGWGVTIEPDGGSPQPTGDIVYQAAL